MHKVILHTAVNKAFALLDVALDLIRAAYATVEKEGEHLFDSVNRAEDELKRSINRLIDEL